MVSELAIPVFAAGGSAKPLRAVRNTSSVLAARWSTSPLRGLRNAGSGSAAQRAGKRYEKKVLQAISKLYENIEAVSVRPSPWIGYTLFSESINDERHCQPDLILETREEIFLCEIKLSHTVDAYWQLSSLYAPVVKKLYPDRPVRLVEITRSFDPAVLFPVDMRLFFSLGHLMMTPRSSAVEVLQWKL